MAKRVYKDIDRVTVAVEGGTPVEHVPPGDYGYAPIAKEKYVSAEYYEKEWQQMWSKVWLLGCLERDLSVPGDFVCTDFGRESVVMVRQQDLGVKAFFNVCPHRGNRLMEEGMGNIESVITCGYHGWQYKLDGRFDRIPNAELFPQGKPCDGLSELPCEIWNGFVWFSMDKNVTPFEEYMAPLKRHFEPYHFERMTMTRDVTIEWPCNWKTSVDAFNETYHVAATHPQLKWYLDDMDIQIDCYARHSRYLVPFGVTSPHIKHVPEVPPPLKYMLSEAGMDPAEWSGPVDNIRKAVQAHLREHAQAQGKDFSDLNDDQLTDDYNYLIFPNVTFNTHADHLMLFRHRPHATDPNQMYFDVWMLEYIVDEAELPRRRPKHKQHAYGSKSMGMVIDQDGYNLPRVQQGMNSVAYQGLWLGDLEVRIRHFHHALDQYVEQPRVSEGGVDAPSVATTNAHVSSGDKSNIDQSNSAASASATSNGWRGFINKIFG